MGQAASILDAITYPRGAVVLHQLMVYVDERAHASGKDLEPWRVCRLETAGTDRLTLEHDDDGFVLVGQGPQGDPGPQVLAIGSYRRTATGLQRLGLTEVELEGGRTPVHLPREADLHLVNDEELSFVTAGPDRSSRARLTRPKWCTASAACCSCRRRTPPSSRTSGTAAESWSPEADRSALEARAVRTSRQLAEQESRRQVALRARSSCCSPTPSATSSCCRGWTRSG